MPLDYLIVGAGAAGVYSSYLLTQKSKQQNPELRIGIIEKSRGVGGRLSTRRLYLPDQTMIQSELGGVVLQPPFQSQLLKDALRKGDLQGDKGQLLDRWEDLVVFRGLGTDVLKHMIQQTKLDSLNMQHRLVKISQEDGLWYPEIEIEGKTARRVDSLAARHIIFTIPAPQVEAILTDSSLDAGLLSQVQDGKMCCRFTWVALLQLKVIQQVQFFFQDDELFDSVFVLSQKPGSQMPQGYASLQINMNLNWSDAHADQSKESVQIQLEQQVKERLVELFEDLKMSQVLNLQVHKWLYAHPKKPLSQPYLHSNIGISVIGDWVHGYGVDSSFYTAEALVNRLT